MTLRVEATLGGRLPADVPFVTSAWMRAAKYCSTYDGVAPEVYNHHEHATIHRLLDDPRVTWLFASYPSDINFRYGFLCGEATDAGPVVHWLYVRKHMREFGVATALLDAFLLGQERGRLFATHDTSDWRNFTRRSSALTGTECVYDPWLLWEGAWR